jgi:hypothetical protein
MASRPGSHGGPGRRHKDRRGASQIPADCNPEVYDEGFWSRVDAWVGQFGRTGPAAIVQASEVPGAGDGLARGWLWRCRGWWSKRRGG